MLENEPAGRALEEPLVPLSRVATFIRQITHDVRNDLNSMDLQAAFAAELVEDPEALQEVKRIRGLIQNSARHLQVISANFQQNIPNFVPYTAAILVEDLRDRIGRLFPENAGEIMWNVDLEDEAVEVDVEMFFGALIELFRNAVHFRSEGLPLEIRAGRDEEGLLFELAEGKAAAPTSPPEEWGVEPFQSTRRSGYGLGLFRARRVLEAHRGTLKISFDPTCAMLRTRVWLPLALPS